MEEIINETDDYQGQTLYDFRLIFNSINKKQIEEIKISSPNLKTQNEMTNKIKILLSHVQEINFNSKLKLNNLNILKSSILKQELKKTA